MDPISLVINVFVLVLIVALLLWLIDQLQPGPRFPTHILRWAIIGVAILVVLGWLVGFIPRWRW